MLSNTSFIVLGNHMSTFSSVWHTMQYFLLMLGSNIYREREAKRGREGQREAERGRERQREKRPIVKSEQLAQQWAEKKKERSTCVDLASWTGKKEKKPHVQGSWSRKTRVIEPMTASKHSSRVSALLPHLQYFNYFLNNLLNKLWIKILLLRQTQNPH